MKRIRFLSPVINFYLIGLIILSVSRILLAIVFYGRVLETDKFWLMFPIGVRFDIIMLSYLAVLPTLLIVLLPFNILNKIKGFFRYFFVICIALLLFMELATPNFLIQYDTRPNRLFVEYLMYPKEVFSTLIKSVGWQILIAVVILIFAIRYLFKKSKSWFSLYETKYTQKLLWLPMVAFLLFLGVRSSLTSKRPINASNAVFSSSQFSNTLALNSLYTVSFAIYSFKHEGDMTKMYGKMDTDKAIVNVKKYMTADAVDFTDEDIPLLHQQKSLNKRE